MKIKNFLKVVVILFVAILGSQNVLAQKKEKEVVKTKPNSTTLAKEKPCQCPSTTINNYYGGSNEEGGYFRGGSYSTFRVNLYGRSNFRSNAYGGYRNYNYNHYYNNYSRPNFRRGYNYGNFRSSGGNFRGQNRSNSYRGGNRGR